MGHVHFKAQKNAESTEGRGKGHVQQSKSHKAKSHHYTRGTM